MSTAVHFPGQGRATLPFNLEAEAAFLGVVLSDSSLLETLFNPVSPEDFFEPVHQRVFRLALDLISRGVKPTPLTLRPHVEDDDGLRQLGGVGYLARLSGGGEGFLAFQGIANQISELAERRRRLEWIEAERAACLDLAEPLAELSAPPARASGSRPFHCLDLATLAEREPKPKAFILPRIAPSGEVTLFTGAAAVGKSLLSQQLATAVAAGVKPLGMEVQQGPAIYITCEDDAEQLHWRQAHICKALGVELRDLAGALHLISWRGEPANALAMFTQDGRVSTPLFSALSALMRTTAAKLVCLDNVAHLFGGNENDRGNATQFVNLLNRLAGTQEAAVLLMGHPNKAGDSYSGSTGWLNAVRSQVTMTRSEDEEADPDVRSLSIGKPNYTKAGEALRMRWHNWAFVLDDALFFDKRGNWSDERDRADDTIFLTCLAERIRQKRAVSENRPPTFAPTVFARMPDSKRIGAKRLEAAMDRLFRTGQIERAELWKGPDRKPVIGLRIVAGNGVGNTMRETRETVL